MENFVAVILEAQRASCQYRLGIGGTDARAVLADDHGNAAAIIREIPRKLRDFGVAEARGSALISTMLGFADLISPRRKLSTSARDRRCPMPRSR
jgi:hypothetical protein